VEGEEDRGRKSKGGTQVGRRQQEKSSHVEDVVQNTKSHNDVYNRSEEEEDDSDTETLSLPLRSEKTAGGNVVSELGGPSTQTYRRMKSSGNAPSTQPTRAVGVAATEVPGTLRPRKNGVSATEFLLLECCGLSTP
jgi:hypothetical protein